ncbi:MAG TPA: hypothetical protein VGH92_03480 [Gaiellaceae bacterium]|jgi:hypothetical protein
MIRAGWRLQRTETLVTAGMLAALALLLIPTGLQMSSAYHHDGLSACLSPNASFGCGRAVESFMSRFSGIYSLAGWFNFVPALAGVLLAAPFLLELEQGTFRLAWTQSITRGRWIAGKLGLAIGVALSAALILTLLITWWRTPFVHLQGRMGANVYDFEGTVVFGYALFPLGLAAALGAVWRRAVPALIVSFGVYVGVRVFFDSWVRQRLVAPLTATWKAKTSGPDLSHAWVLAEGPSGPSGHIIPFHIGPCFPGRPRCTLNPPGHYMHAVYHPASHFWPLQGIETAIFAGVALVLLAFAAWWTHERVA